MLSWGFGEVYCVREALLSALHNQDPVSAPEILQNPSIFERVEPGGHLARRLALIESDLKEYPTAGHKPVRRFGKDAAMEVEAIGAAVKRAGGFVLTHAAVQPR